MITRIISFHNGNLNPELLEMQQAVFDYFKLQSEQIQTNLPHAEAIDHFLTNEQWDRVVLFDADCIPIDRDVVNESLLFCDDRIISVAQKASHIPNSQIYASPCFMVISKKIFELLGGPSFKATSRGDVAEEISYAARAAGIPLALMMPSEVEVPLWPLTNELKFGYGTTYNTSIYHAFESNANHQSTTRFIEKCQEVLGHN